VFWLGDMPAQRLAAFLHQGNNLRIFNYVMGGSLVIVALYLAFMDK